MSHLDILPAGIVIESLMNIVVETLAQPVHERSAWSNAVGVKMFTFLFDRWHFQTYKKKESDEIIAVQYDSIKI